MAREKGFTIGKVRKVLYQSSRTLGDINSVVRGTVPARIGTRIIGPLFSKALGGIIRLIFGKR
ncbi:MAG: hypothetical protein JW925_10715 [Syntrophaceae bacterium]|nr:hypothetical protein [Syntrophaceae bacterium]